MTTVITRLSGSAFELTLTIPWANVKAIYDRVFEELAAEIEVEGFRKGKAPKTVVESKIDKAKIFGEVVNRILPDSYQKALGEHNLRPIMAPKVQIVSGEEEKDWQFLVRACERPSVDLDDYKKHVSEINAKGKIWVPGKDEDKNQTQDTGSGTQGRKQEEEKSKRIGEIIEKLLEVCKVDLAELLVESEVTRLVSQLIDDVRNAGLTFEQYLASKQQTSEQIQRKYRQQAETALKLEFILGAIADDLKIEVSQAEIDAIINKETDPGKKATLKEQSYVLAGVLRRENTITRLLTL